jgi:hypothetical protein
MPEDMTSDPAPAPSLQVQKITCVNNAGFVMRFCVEGPSFATPSSGDYPIDQTREIDVAESGAYVIPGTVIQPLVHALDGKTKSGPPVIFEQNGLTAVYSVTGTTLDYSIKLIS